MAWTKINILLEVEEGVIERDKVFEAETNVVEVVLLAVESVALTTWITCPAAAPTVAKLNEPEPFVINAWLADPSALGKVNVKFEAILSAALRAT